MGCRLVVNLVLDTNVVIDWLVFDDPFLSAFREQVRHGRVKVFTHQPAVDELRRVLGYRELKLDAARQAQVLERYQAHTACLPLVEHVPRAPLELPRQFPRCRDPDDNHFLALAYHVKADALVSRDNAVLKLARRARKFGFQIMNVPQMVAAISQTQALRPAGRPAPRTAGPEWAFHRSSPARSRAPGR